MNRHQLTKRLEPVAAGRIRTAKAAGRKRRLSAEDIEYAPIDHHRFLRKGFPEVVFGQGKTIAPIAAVLKRIRRRESIVRAPRVNPEKAAAVLPKCPDAPCHPDARMTRC